MNILNINKWGNPSNDLLTEISYNLLYDHQTPNNDMCKVISFLMILENVTVIDWNFYRWSYNLNLDNLEKFREFTGDLYSSNIENKEKTLIKLKALSIYRRFRFIPPKKDDVDELVNELSILNI